MLARSVGSEDGPDSPETKCRARTERAQCHEEEVGDESRVSGKCHGWVDLSFPG